MYGCQIGTKYPVLHGTRIYKIGTNKGMPADKKPTADPSRRKSYVWLPNRDQMSYKPTHNIAGCEPLSPPETAQRCLRQQPTVSEQQRPCKGPKAGNKYRREATDLKAGLSLQGPQCLAHCGELKGVLQAYEPQCKIEEDLPGAGALDCLQCLVERSQLRGLKRHKLVRSLLSEHIKAISSSCSS
jgi:hypothetical protein